MLIFEKKLRSIKLTHAQCGDGPQILSQLCPNPLRLCSTTTRGAVINGKRREENDVISPRFHSNLGVKNFVKTLQSVPLRTVAFSSAPSPLHLFWSKVNPQVQQIYPPSVYLPSPPHLSGAHSKVTQLLSLDLNHPIRI